METQSRGMSAQTLMETAKDEYFLVAISFLRIFLPKTLRRIIGSVTKSFLLILRHVSKRTSPELKALKYTGTRSRHERARRGEYLLAESQSQREDVLHFWFMA